MSGFADYFLAVVIGLLVIGAFYLAYLAKRDRRQVHHTLLVNYPVVGRLRYYFEDLGKYFRQYWFANDNEELPFSRAVRSQVYRMSKGISNKLSFGSTSTPKSEIFKNSLFPLEPHEADHNSYTIIGGDCEMPFTQRKVFNISGMSFGALSGRAIEALSIGAAQAGLTFNTGEGGRPSKHHRTNAMQSGVLPGGLVLQLGTSNFGYRDENGRLDFEKLAEVRTDPTIRFVSLKMSQGAKPGLGGILPGAKVTPEIAELRGVPAGVDCLSPSKNPDCSTPAAMLTTIRRIKEVTGKPCGIKLALGGVEELRDLMKLAIVMDREMQHPEPSHIPSVIHIDGGDGGTGSAPALFMESLALPIRDILPEVDRMLVDLNIRDKVHLVASGRLVTAHDVAVALALGADSVESARGFMMAIGCINAMECANDTCPVGIATQNPKLQKALVPSVKAQRVVNYAKAMEKELFDLALACGINHPRDFNQSHLVSLEARDTPNLIAKAS